MGHYRLFPSTSGPTSATSYSGTYSCQVAFEVTQSDCWFEGFWWWVAPTGGLTAAQHFALYNIGSPSGGGTLVPLTSVASGTLSAGWNYVPLGSPIPLSVNTSYAACTSVNGNFPEGPGQYASGGTYSAGIVNGPLKAFSDTSGSAPEPYGHAQGGFSTTTSDVWTNGPVLNGNSGDNLWMDLQVTDVRPVTAVTRQIWPNKFDASPNVSVDQAVDFVLGTKFTLTQPANLDYVWWFSIPTAASLPTWAGIYRISDQALVAVNTSPSWISATSGGSATAGGGRCKTAVSGFLPPGDYVVAVYNANGTSGGWSPTTYGYFNGTGGGANGIVNGPLVVPSNSNASNSYVYFNQPSNTPPYTDGHSQEAANGAFAQTGPQFPYLAVDYTFPGTSDPAGAVAESFWVDVELTPVPESMPVVPAPWQFRPHEAPGEPFAPWPPWAQGAQQAVTVQGTAALAASSTLSSPAVQVSGATLAAGSSLAATAVQGAGASLGASSSLGAPAVQEAGASLTASSTLTASGGGTVPGAAALTSSSALAAPAVQGAAATLTAASSLAATATQQPTALLSASSSLSSPAIQGGLASLAALSALTAGSGGAVPGTATLTAASTLTAPGALAGGAPLTALSTLTAPVRQEAGAALTAASALSAPSAQLAAAALAAAATLTAIGSQRGPFTVGILTAADYAPSGSSSTSSGINAASTAP